MPHLDPYPEKKQSHSQIKIKPLAQGIMKLAEIYVNHQLQNMKIKTV
jgi:hypothetical protein